MADHRVIDVFCEDFGHENFIVPLIRRVCTESGVDPRIKPVSARGGSSRIWSELAVYSASITKGLRPPPSLLVVCLDSNCVGHAKRRMEAEARIPSALADRLVVACPNAHIEQWYLIDQAAFSKVVGGRVQSVPDKCERGLYKSMLQSAVKQAGQSPLQGGLEFGPDLVDEMNLFQVAKDDPALGTFLADLRRKLKPDIVPS